MRSKQKEKGSDVTTTADYIATHLREISGLARKENMTLLVYLLDMAQEEAMNIADQIRLCSED